MKIKEIKRRALRALLHRFKTEFSIEKLRGARFQTVFRQTLEEKDPHQGETSQIGRYEL